jgi:hypothetical protein
VGDGRNRSPADWSARDDNWGPVAFEREERYDPRVIEDADRHGSVRDDWPTRVDLAQDGDWKPRYRRG